jgi:hypothetical protein
MATLDWEWTTHERNKHNSLIGLHVQNSRETIRMGFRSKHRKNTWKMPWFYGLQVEKEAEVMFKFLFDPYSFHLKIFQELKSYWNLINFLQSKERVHTCSFYTRLSRLPPEHKLLLLGTWIMDPRSTKQPKLAERCKSMAPLRGAGSECQRCRGNFEPKKYTCLATILEELTISVIIPGHSGLCS